MKTPKTNYERLFKITRKKNTINLSGSMSVIDGKASEENFENEAFQITFSSRVTGVVKECNLLVVANECVCEEEKEKLQKQLGIVLEGDGMYFDICSYEQDFTIQIDTLNSAFIDTNSVQKGMILFAKGSLE